MQCDEDGNPIDSRIQEAVKRGRSIPLGAANYYGIRAGGAKLALPDMAAGDDEDDGATSRRRKRASQELDFGEFSSEDESGGDGGGGGDSSRGRKENGSGGGNKRRRPAEPAVVDAARDEVRIRLRELAGAQDEANDEGEEDSGGGRGGDEDGGPGRFRMCRAPDLQELEAAFNEKAKPATSCFGCTHGRKSGSLTFEEYKKIERTFNEKLSTTEAVSLSKLLAAQYEALRVKANKHRQPDETEMPVWDAPTIYDHFMFHMNDFTLRTAGRLKMLNTLIRYQYENGCWLEIGRGRKRRVVPSERGIKQLKDLITLEARLYAQKPRNAMFSSAGIGTNSDDVRSLIEKDKLAFHTKSASALKGSSVVSLSQGGRGGTVHGKTK